MFSLVTSKFLAMRNITLYSVPININYLPPAERTAKVLNDNKDLVAIPEAIINLPERLEIESGQPPLSAVVVLKFKKKSV